MEDQAIVYSSQRLTRTRSLTSVLANTTSHRFLVGSMNLHSDNEIHLLEYSEQKEEVWCAAYFSHKHEIWGISPCPSQEDLFFTIYNTGSEFKTTLWKMPQSVLGGDEEDDEFAPLSDKSTGSTGSSSVVKGKKPPKQKEAASEPLANLLTLEPHAAPLNSVLWDPSNVTDRVLTVDSAQVKEWRIDHQKKTSSAANEYKLSRRLTCGKWDPHHNDTVAVCAAQKIIQLDLRTKKPGDTIENAHDQRVRDIDYNPYVPYQLVSGGDDCKVKFWDVRRTNEPLRIVCGHSHWVSNVKYNPLYDQLVLSSGTDSLVNLWRIPSIASKPVSAEDDAEDDDAAEEQLSKQEKAKKKQQQQLKMMMEAKDGLVKTIDDNEDSVYSVAWGVKNGWIFATAAYDGRILIHHVPQAERFRILKIQ